MKKLFYISLITFCLSSCAFFSPHKRDIEQGNIFSDQQVAALHVGMSENEVKRIMGSEPIMKNIFTPNEVVYVYSTQPGGKERTQKQVICTFHSGRLATI